MFAFLDKFVSAHLHILIEEIATQHLLAVTVVENVRSHEEETEGALCHELHVLVVEEDVVVVEEETLLQVIGLILLTVEIVAKIKYFL